MRGRALTLAYVTTGVAMLATGLAMFVGLPPLIVYVLAASVVVAYTSIRPIQSAILPAVVGRAEHLTAANALSTLLEGTGVLIGPLLCGLVLTVASPAATCGRRRRDPDCRAAGRSLALPCQSTGRACGIGC